MFLRERDKITSRLKRKSRQILTQFNFQDLEDTYITTTNFYSRSNSRIDDWADLLETNEEGDTIYPDNGVSGYCYSPEVQQFPRNTRMVEEVLSFSQEVMIRFLMSLPARE